MISAIMPHHSFVYLNCLLLPSESPAGRILYHREKSLDPKNYQLKSLYPLTIVPTNYENSIKACYIHQVAFPPQMLARAQLILARAFESGYLMKFVTISIYNWKKHVEFDVID